MRSMLQPAHAGVYALTGPLGGSYALPPLSSFVSINACGSKRVCWHSGTHQYQTNLLGYMIQCSMTGLLVGSEYALRALMPSKTCISQQGQQQHSQPCVQCAR